MQELFRILKERSEENKASMVAEIWSIRRF